MDSAELVNLIIEKLRRVKFLKIEAYSVEQLEKDQNQHEIKMTDDPHYRDWYRKEQKRKEIEEHGIDEK